MVLTIKIIVHLLMHLYFDVQPYLKSEEPDAQDMIGPVKVIKGKSFEKEVLNSTKDVLLEFYAPWW